MSNTVNDYEVTEARFIGGQHRTLNEPVRMTDRAAKYYTAPYGTGLKLVTAARAKPGPKPSGQPATAEG